MALFYGNQATVTVGATIATVSSTATLDSQQSGTDFSAEIKEISFSGGESGVEALNVLGDQLKEESRPDLKTCEFTMTFEDIDMLESFFGTASAVGSTGYSRVDAETEKTGNREDKSILFTLTSGSDVIAILMNDAWFTTTGDISLAADGSAELTMTAVCLLKDFYMEDNIS